MYFVIFILVILGILTTQFHKVALHGQFVAQKNALDEYARQTAEAAYEEVFSTLMKESGDPNSAVGKWLIEGSSLISPLKDPSSVIPVTKKYADGLVWGLLPEFLLETKVIDFRTTDSKSPPSKYYGKEGVGTLQISVKVTLKNRSNEAQKASFLLVRHHDFKIVSITSSSASHQKGYAHNFLFDYVFFIRQGFQEFTEKVAQNLNPPNLKLVISQPPAAKGKIYFGGTTTASQAVYLNVAETSRFAGIVPPLPWSELKRIGRDECLELFPKIKASVTGDALEKIRGMAGVFYAGSYPLLKTVQTGPIGAVEELTFQSLWQATQGVYRNENPGVEILTDDPKSACDPEFAKSILEGYIRQRFFYFSAFFLDLTKIDSAVAAELKGYNNWYPCLKEKIPGNPPQDLVDFWTQLKTRYGDDAKLFSHFNSSYPFLGGQSLAKAPQEPAFPLPTFFNSAGKPIPESAGGSDGLQPFNHVNLWGRKMADNASLERFGIVDKQNGIINLRGFVWLGKPDGEDDSENATIEIGDPNRVYKIRGQGGIFAKSRNFRIRGSLVKEMPGNVCVLFTRNGNISIDTDQRVDAALIALGGNKASGGFVTPRKNLDLHGMIAAEWFDPKSWSSAGSNHRILFDEALRGGDQYQINISPSITFQRMLENQF